MNTRFPNTLAAIGAALLDAPTDAQLEDPAWRS